MADSCPLCGRDATAKKDLNNSPDVSQWRWFIECPACGGYEISHRLEMEVASPHQETIRGVQKHLWSGATRHIWERSEHQDWVVLTSETAKEGPPIPAPTGIDDKLRLLVLHVGLKSPGPGQRALLNPQTDGPLLFLENGDDLYGLAKMLCDEELATDTGVSNLVGLILTRTGWSVFEQLQATTESPPEATPGGPRERIGF